MARASPRSSSPCGQFVGRCIVLCGTHQRSPWLVLPASGHLPHAHCQVDLRHPGQTQPNLPAHTQHGSWFHSRPAATFPQCAHTFPVEPCGLTSPFLPKAPCFTAGHPLLSPPSSGLVLYFTWETDKTPRETKTLTPPPLTYKSFGASLSLSCFFVFFCVRFVLFIPSKLPEQLMVADKSGTFALFTFT